MLDIPTVAKLCLFEGVSTGPHMLVLQQACTLKQINRVARVGAAQSSAGRQTCPWARRAVCTPRRPQQSVKVRSEPAWNPQNVPNPEVRSEGGAICYVGGAAVAVLCSYLSRCSRLVFQNTCELVLTCRRRACCKYTIMLLMQVMPSPDFSAEQAVRVQLDALSKNDTPW